MNTLLLRNTRAGTWVDRQADRITLNHLEERMLENNLRLFLRQRKITTSQVELLTPNIEGVSGGIVNILGGGSMDYSE